jgi:hypothetical protein
MVTRHGEQSCEIVCGGGNSHCFGEFSNNHGLVRWKLITILHSILLSFKRKFFFWSHAVSTQIHPSSLVPLFIPCSFPCITVSFIHTPSHLLTHLLHLQLFLAHPWPVFLYIFTLPVPLLYLTGVLLTIDDGSRFQVHWYWIGKHYGKHSSLVGVNT